MASVPDVGHPVNWHDKNPASLVSKPGVTEVLPANYWQGVAVLQEVVSPEECCIDKSCPIVPEKRTSRESGLGTMIEVTYDLGHRGRDDRLDVSRPLPAT